MTSLLVSLSMMALGAAPSDSDVLSKADERIQKYRTGELVVRLLDASGRPVTNATAELRQTRHAFLFGSNVFVLNSYKEPEANAAYAKHFAELWNFATLPFYWWAYEGERGKPDYDKTEAMIRWCREHGIACKGHPLAWNYVDPAWLPDAPAEAMRLQMDRIEACAKRFTGEIQYWDVVNEAVKWDRPQCKGKSPKLTAAIEKMGVPAYLLQAFESARRGNPKASLIINDYITDQEYADKVISRLVDDSGKPLYDIIGIQCHQHGGAWSPSKAWEICERFSKFGKPLHFTEATIVSGRRGWDLKAKDPKADWSSTPEGEKRQAEEVVSFYKVLFSHPSVEAITWWDFADRHAWQGAPAGFLRQDMTPKPAYDALKRLVKGQWWTTAKHQVNDSGLLRLRAFYGDYEISLVSGDKPLAAKFTFNREQAVPIEVRLR